MTKQLNNSKSFLNHFPSPPLELRGLGLRERLSVLGPCTSIANRKTQREGFVLALGMRTHTSQERSRESQFRLHRPARSQQEFWSLETRTRFKRGMQEMIKKRIHAAFSKRHAPEFYLPNLIIYLLVCLSQEKKDIGFMAETTEKMHMYFLKDRLKLHFT